MGVTILDRQPIKIKKRWIRNAVKEILKYLGIEGSLSVVFVSPEEIRSYNKKFRNTDDVTDVISFPFGEDNYLGDIIICPQVVKENSEEFNTTFEDELLLVLIHGVLHLLGYSDYSDEEKEIMYSKQEEVFFWVKRAL